MAIGKFPDDSSNYTTTYFIPSGANIREFTFTNLKKGLYKAPQLVSTWTYKTNPTDLSAIPGQRISSEALTGYRNLLYANTVLFLEDASGNTYLTYNANNYGNGMSFEAQADAGLLWSVATDNTTLRVRMQTFSTTQVAWGNYTLTSNNYFKLVFGNTVIAYRDATFDWTVTSGEGNIYYWGTNTTTFSTTSISPISGTNLGTVGKVRYQSTLANPWVAVGSSATSNGNPVIYSSTNGQTWTSRTVGGTWITNQSPTFSRINCVTFSNSVWAAGGVVVTTTTPSTTCAARIWTSTDSITWNQTYTTTLATTGRGFTHIAGENTLTEKFAAFNHTLAGIYTSTDATTWTLRSTAYNSATANALNVSVANARYYVVSRDAFTYKAYITYSTNGTTWSNATIKYFTDNSDNIGEVQYISNLYYACTKNGVLVSTDGITFEYIAKNVLNEWQGAANYTTNQQAGSYDFPLGIELYSDGTRFGKVYRPYSGNQGPDIVRVFYTTNTFSDFLYGSNHPDVEYVAAMQKPSTYPRTLP